MSSNLLISYPDALFAAWYIDPSVTAATGHEAENLATGSRGTYYQAEIAGAGTLTITIAQTVDCSANHLILSRANLLKGDGVTEVYLKAGPADLAPDVIYANTIWSNTSFASASMVGNREEDYIATFADSTAYKYWYFQAVNASATALFPLGKIYLGTFFDMGRDPIVDVDKSRRARTSGARDAGHSFTLTWQGVTDAKRSEFNSKILQYRDVNPIYLYDSGNVLLNDLSIFNCTVKDVSIKPVARDTNTITATFEELI